MRRRTTPIGWPRRNPRHYRLALPNALWEYKLKPVELVIFSYLCYHNSTSKPTLEEIAVDIHITAGTVSIDAVFHKSKEKGRRFKIFNNAITK